MTSTASPTIPLGGQQVTRTTTGAVVTVNRVEAAAYTVTFQRPDGGVSQCYAATFVAEMIPFNQTPAQAAAEYAGRLVAENGGPEMPVGMRQSKRIGCVRVAFQHTGHHAYLITVEYGSSGAPVEELTRSATTEAEAREVANGFRTLFLRGSTVQAVLDSTDNARTTADQIAA